MKRLVLMIGISGLLFTQGVPARAQQASATEQAQALARSARIRYNRAEGLFLGYGFSITPPTWKGLGLFGDAGYGFDSRSIRWETGLKYTHPKGDLTFSLFDHTETNDREIIRTFENTIFALLYKGDYRDYFRAHNGFELKTTYRFRRQLLLIGRLTGFTYESLPVEAQWSLFRKNKDFRANPAVRPGNMGLLQTGLIWDTRRRSPLFRNAWTLTGLYERGFRDFEYNGLIVDFKRYQKLVFGNQAFVLHGRLGTRESTAEQHLFDQGGVSTLRGFDIKEFTGNRQILINFDYLFRGDALGRIPLPGFHLLSLILFFDTGWVAQQPRDAHLFDGFQDLRIGDFKSSAGVAVAVTRQVLRFNLARRLDRSDRVWTFSARFVRSL